MVPDVPAVHRQFDYVVPERFAPDVRVGTRVRIVLQGRRVGGWVVADGVEPPPGVVLQPLAAVSGWGPPGPVIDLAFWAAWRWAGPVSALLTSASPSHRVGQLPPPSRGMEGPVAGATPALAPGLATAVEAALGRTERPTLLRLPPAMDLLPLVETVVRRAEVSAGPGRGALVLVPGTGWAERLRRRLVARGIPATGDWAEAAAGWPVVVGSRAAAWAPRPGLSVVLVLDVHDEAYREERTPTTDAAEVAAERAARAGVPCLLVSPCPTAVQRARAELVTPDRAIEREGWPVLQIVDRKGADPRTGLYSEELVAMAHRALEHSSDPLVCVLNRTGRAKLLACSQCGELARCTICGRPLHQVDDRLVCPGCGAERPVVCAACGSTRLKLLRVGVSRAREELEALLGVAVTEVAGPSGRGTTPGGTTGEAAEDPSGAPARVLVGTEAVLHRVRRASGVAFLDVDQHLLAPRFVAAEETLGLLARAARLVGGRGASRGVVLVQTRMADHELLQAVLHGDPGRLDAAESDLRRELGLPPAGALALCSGAVARPYAESLVEAGGPVEVRDLGDGRFLLRAEGHQELCDLLARVPRPKGRLRVEVDPTAV